MEDNHYINFNEGQKSLLEYHTTFLKKFYEVEIVQTKKSLHSSHQSKNWIEIKKILSSLKGTSGFVGALTCKMHVEILQTALNESSLDEVKIGCLLSQLFDHLDKLSKYLENYFCDSQRNDKSKENISDVIPKIADELGMVVVVKKLVPPISRIVENEYNGNHYDDEIAFEEVCRQWSCFII